MSEHDRLKNVWRESDFDPDHSRPVNLADSPSPHDFERIELGRTPWPSDQDLDAIRARARQEGQQEGRRLASQEVAQQQAQLVAELTRLIDSMRRPYANHAESMTKEMAKLSVTLGTALFRRALEIEPDRIVPIARDAVSMLADNSSPLSITMHPLDAEICRNLLVLDDDPELEIVDDDTLERGGLRVTTNVSEVNATVQARVEQLVDSMFETDSLMEMENGDEQSATRD